jgi:anti-sigma regulatory factor (Ser/Thr protein kinase)
MQAAPETEQPLQTHLELAALPSAVPCARGHVRAVALEWGLGKLADNAELLVSELVTNAIQVSEKLRTAATPVVRVWVTSDGISMVIHVWDASAAMPIRQAATAVDDEGGRGLLMVETLSKEWGTYRKAAGKVVWVMIAAAGPRAPQ